MSIITPTPWTRQPQFRVLIDRSSRYAKGLTEAILPYQLRSIVGGLVASLNGSLINTSPGVGGSARVQTTENSTAWDTYAGSWANIAAPFSLLAVYRLTATPTQSVRTAGTFVGTTSGYAFSPTASNFRALVGAAGANTVVTGSAVHTRPKVDVLTHDGTNLQFWENGVLSGTAAGSYAAGTSAFRVGIGEASFVGAKAEHYLYLLFNRVLSAAEIRDLAQDPWQVFQPLPRREWVPGSASGTSHTLTGDAAGQAATSGTAGITQHHAVTAAASTQAAACAAISITQAQVLAAESSTQAATSSAAAIALGAINALTGAASVQGASGSTAAIAQAHVISGATGTQAAASASAAISLGAVSVLAGASTTQAATCSAAGITQRHVILCAPATADNIAAGSAIVQRHLLAAGSATQSAVASAAALVTPGSAEPTPALPMHVQRAAKRRFGRVEYASGFRRIGWPRPIE